MYKPLGEFFQLLPVPFRVGSQSNRPLCLNGILSSTYGLYHHLLVMKSPSWISWFLFCDREKAAHLRFSGILDNRCRVFYAEGFSDRRDGDTCRAGRSTCRCGGFC